MTLLTICQNIADASPVDKPTLIVGSTDGTARLLLSCAQNAGKYLARRKGKQHWLELVNEYTFSTVADQEDYDLPSDFYDLEDQTLWDRTNYWEIRGALSPQDWQAYKSSVLGDTATVRKRFRIRNVSGTTKFSIHPTPSAVESLVFEYVSNNWCESSGGTGQDSWQADSDVGIIDEYLIELEARWRFLNRLGMAYAEEKNEAEREISAALARNGGTKILSITGRTEGRLVDAGNIPDTGFGNAS